MLSTSHLIIILLIFLLLFGAGKFPSIMADIAKGLKSFKKSLNEDDVSDPKVSSDSILTNVNPDTKVDSDKSKSNEL